MKYFISSLGFWSKNVTSILNKNILLLKKTQLSYDHDHDSPRFIFKVLYLFNNQRPTCACITQLVIQASFGLNKVKLKWYIHSYWIFMFINCVDQKSNLYAFAGHYLTMVICIKKNFFLKNPKLAWITSWVIQAHVTKIHHPRNIPAMFAIKWCSGFRYV
jgi:hypothetical protein